MTPSTIAQIRATATAMEEQASAPTTVLGCPPVREKAPSEYEHERACRQWARSSRQYMCDRCGEVHARHSDAEECCAPEVIDVYVDANGKVYESASAFAEAIGAGLREAGQGPIPNNMCPVCAEKHKSPHEAVECCLWHELAAPARWELAAALEAGGNWAEELRKLGVA